MKVFLAATILLVASSVFTQSTQQGILIDEVNKTTCEDLLARTDSFAIQLQTDPSTKGTAIVFGDSTNVMNYPLLFMHRAIIGRWGLKVPVEFYLVDSKGPWRIQFWKGLKNILTIDPAAKLQETIPFAFSEPFLFGRVSGDPCSNHIEKGFLDVLRSNSNYSARIVEYNLSRKERGKSVDYWLDFLRKNNISKKRLRLFFSRNSENHEWAETALWIIPSKIRVR